MTKVCIYCSLFLLPWANGVVVHYANIGVDIYCCIADVCGCSVDIKQLWDKMDRVQMTVEGAYTVA